MSRSPLSRRVPVHHGHYATNPHGERFTVGHADAYSATGSIVVEGEVKLAFQGVVASDGAWYQKVRADAVVSEEDYAPRDGTLYRRYTITEEERAGQLRERITDDEDGMLVRERREGDRVTFVVEETTTNATEPVSGTASVFVNSLFVVGYADDGRPSSGTARYEPRSGWYDGRRTYRITDASGTVRATADTHVVRSANVSWEETTPAGSYAAYILARSTSDDPAARRITYEFDPSDADLDRPNWVDETEAE